MPFLGYLETFIHFHTLRNIDLFHQGLYQVRCHVYRDLGHAEYVAGMPWRVSTSPLEAVSEHRRKPTTVDTHALAPAFIRQSNRSFSTRIFQIRFCDEEVELNDGVTFRLEVDFTRPISYNAPLYIEFQLLYTETPSNTSRKVKRSSENHLTQRERRHLRKKNRTPSASPPSDDFLASPLREQTHNENQVKTEQCPSYSHLNWTPVAYQVFRVKDPIAGQISYVQVTFDHLHFCVCHCTLYTALIDIRQGFKQSFLTPVLQPRHNQPKTPASFNHAVSGKKHEHDQNTDTQASSDAVSFSQEQLTTPRDSAPYWTTYRASLADITSHNICGTSNLLDHLAVVVRALSVQRTSGKGSLSQRRSTVDGLSRSPTHRLTNTRATLSPNIFIPEEIEPLRIVLSRADQVYQEYLTMLTRTYYRLRAYITTISYRCFSEKESRELNWIWLSGKQFYLPGKLTVEARSNGLPSQSSNLINISKLSTMSFTIPAHLCKDAAQELFATNDIQIAGATRSVSLPFYPLSARLRTNLLDGDDPCDQMLISEIHSIFVEDLNLVWSQVHESWQKLKVLVSLAHRETQYFHQLIWEKRIAARSREIIYLELHATRSACASAEQDIGFVHNRIADDLRVSRKLKELPTLPMEDVHAQFDPLTHPILFEERYTDDPIACNVVAGYVERRDRLSNIHGGLRGAVPDLPSPSHLGLYKPLELGKLRIQEPDAGEILLTNRNRGNKEPRENLGAAFQDLKALALMKQAGDEAMTARTQVTSPGPSTLEHPDTQRHISGCTTSDSIDSLQPADEDVALTKEDLHFLKVNCPIFEQIPSAPKLHSGGHLIVMVHGFQGNSMDMRLLRNQFSLVFPESMYLASSCNEDQTEGDISAMGSRLAAEILNYMSELCPAETIGRVSFVGHSLGGLIVRAALPHLQSIAPKFHLFLTLSSPHLGYIFARNRLVDAGLWVLKKWKKSVSLQQLSMSDHRDPRSTFLYHLSQRDDLKWFKNIVFVSCFQDQYIPYESARVEISSKIKADLVWGSIHTEMVKNILSSIAKHNLIRMDTCFKIADRSLDSLIGRTAHIQFLGSQQLAQTLVMTYPQWFS